MDADSRNAAAYSLLELNTGVHDTHHQQQHHHVTNYPSSSSSSPSLEQQRLRRHFENHAGIRPSNGWLEQCMLHIRNSITTGTNNNNIEEEIWNQILHADLRDVVRVPPRSSERNDDDITHAGATNSAAMILRNAVRQSSKNYINDSRNDTNTSRNFQSSKVVLPSDFQLLVQIEELVDVTMNGEQQLAADGDNPVASVANNTYNTSRQQQQQQQNYGSSSRNSKYRCLKMVFSDGYNPDGNNSLSEANLLLDEDGREEHRDQVIMFARETSPILNLSLSSPPGIKLILRGPVDVRCGMLELNDGNCIVAGGEIESWKSIRSKAKEKAQRERGLGVDPTIKALIWNPIVGDEDGMYFILNE
jgi:hypothetical protein